MNKSYKETLNSTKYSLTMLGLVVISLLFITFSDTGVIDLSAFNWQSYAAVFNGQGQISFSDDSANEVLLGSEQEVSVFATTNNKDVVGFQLLIELDGNIPENIAFVPNNIPGLQVVRNNKTEENTIQVAFIAPLADSFVPFSTGQALELGKVTYTAPEAEGSFELGFDSENTLIIEYLTNKDIAKVPSPITYSFVAPVPSPSPSPTPTIVPTPSPSPVPSPTLTPIPTPSPSPVSSPSPTPVPSPSPIADAALTVKLDITDEWSTGYCANVLITNNGSTTLNDWSLTLDLKDAVMTSHWGFDFTQVGTQYKLTPQRWSRRINPGRTSRDVGFCARKSGGAATPVVISIGDSVPTPSVSPTPVSNPSPTPTIVPSPSPIAGNDNQDRTSKFRKWFRSFVRTNWSWNR